MTTAMAPQHLKFSSKSENIPLVEKLINSVCESYKISEDHYGNIMVTLTEAVANAIYHGNKGDESKNVEVSFIPGDKLIRFSVKDEGKGFDFNNLPDPTSPENIDKPNGRGVFLMRSLSDNVTFENNGATVNLDFKLQ